MPEIGDAIFVACALTVIDKPTMRCLDVVPDDVCPAIVILTFSKLCFEYETAAFLWDIDSTLMRTREPRVVGREELGKGKRSLLHTVYSRGQDVIHGRHPSCQGKLL